MEQTSVELTPAPYEPHESQEQRVQRNQAIIALLNAWEQEDETEQRDTLQFLMQALDEDRLSDRKLFS